MVRPVEVRALPGYRLWLRYSDGVEGEVDLSGFAGKGVFKAWSDYAIFAGARIGAHGEIIWNDELDMCPDALYMRLTDKTPEELFPKLNQMRTDA